MRLGKLLSDVNKKYLIQRRVFEGSQNKIIRGIAKKEEVLSELEGLFACNKDLLDASIDFMKYAPDDTLIGWIQFILGGLGFIEQNDIETTVAEIVILRVNDEVQERRDFDYIETLYKEDLQLYADVADTRNKSQEETGKTSILVNQLSKETKDLGDRILAHLKKIMTLE